MPISRRQLLARALAAAGAGAAGYALWPRPEASAAPHPGVLLNLRGPDGYAGQEGAQAAEDLYDQFRFVVTDLATMSSREMSAPFPAHSLAASPEAPGICLLVEKWGTHSASIDYQEMEQLSLVELDGDRQFIGHAAIRPGGATAVVSEGHFTPLDTRYARGVIGERDVRSLELVREFPSYGENPHELLLIEGGRTLVVANQGTENRAVPTDANLAYIDVESGELIESVPFPRTGHALAHMRVFPNGDAVLVSKSRTEATVNAPNGVYVRFGREPIAEIPVLEGYERTFIDEMLSIDLDRTRLRAATTCPESGHVVFWDLAARTMLRAESLQRPLGVALTADQAHYVVNDIEAGLYVYDADSLERVEHFLPEELAGLHLTAPHATIVAAS